MAASITITCPQDGRVSVDAEDARLIRMRRGFSISYVCPECSTSRSRMVTQEELSLLRAAGVPEVAPDPPLTPRPRAYSPSPPAELRDPTRLRLTSPSPENAPLTEDEFIAFGKSLEVAPPTLSTEMWRELEGAP